LQWALQIKEGNRKRERICYRCCWRAAIWEKKEEGEVEEEITIPCHPEGNGHQEARRKGLERELLPKRSEGSDIMGV